MGLGLVLMEGWVAPGLQDFDFEGLFGTTWLTKPMLQLVIAFILVAAFWLIGARHLKVVPNKKQFAFETLYGWIRNSIARESIGPTYQKWTPLLVTVFTFVILNNWFGEFFYFMFPTFSNVGYTYGVVIGIWLTYVIAGFMAHGIGYIKMSLVPQGVPPALWILIAPMEFISNFLVRPMTLSIRLFANMFAGHMAVLVFVVGGGYLLTVAGNLIYNTAGVFAMILGVVIMALELFIGYLQAYIFTMLTAQYIGTSVAESH